QRRLLSRVVLGPAPLLRRKVPPPLLMERAAFPLCSLQAIVHPLGTFGSLGLRGKLSSLSHPILLSATMPPPRRAQARKDFPSLPTRPSVTTPLQLPTAPRQQILMQQSSQP